MNKLLKSYYWRPLTPVQTAKMIELIEAGNAEPIPTSAQRCSRTVELKRVAGGRYYISENGAVRAGYTLAQAKP